jgi:hypothetical protein
VYRFLKTGGQARNRELPKNVHKRRKTRLRVKKILDDVIGDFRIKLEVIEGGPGLHDYGIPRQSWLRGVRFMKHFGAERALELIDQRAEKEADRGDYGSSRRWRTLITAIHAVQEDELLLGEKRH